MPLYEFKCRKCSKQFEDLVYGDTKSACPACKSEDLERLLSVVAVGGGKPDLPPSPCGSCPGAGSCGMN